MSLVFFFFFDKDFIFLVKKEDLFIEFLSFIYFEKDFTFGVLNEDFNEIFEITEFLIFEDDRD